MEKVYTGTWSLYKQDRFIIKKGLKVPKRPNYNEIVGESRKNKLISFFVEDAKQNPKSTDVLSKLKDEGKVTPAKSKKKNTKDLRISYIVCRHCSVEFPSTSHNRLYCDECAAIRKKISNSASFKRKSNSRSTEAAVYTLQSKKHYPNVGCDGETFGRIKVIDYAVVSGANSLYNCKCDCGTEFIASHAVLKSKAIQACPNCTNKEAGYDRQFEDGVLKNSSSNSPIIIQARKFGFLDTEAKINNSLALCNCGCGKRIIVPIQGLLDGSVASCGCYDETENKAKRDFKYALVDQKIGHLTVVNKTNLHKGKISLTSELYNCQCNCGNKALFTRGSLDTARTRGNILTCGCELKTQKDNLEETLD